MADFSPYKPGQIGKRMVADSMGWFDADPAKMTANEGVAFAHKLIKELMRDDLTEVKAKDKGQLLAYLAKAVDQLSRLVQFSQGEADTRTEVTVASLLPHLLPEELDIFDRALARLASTGDGGDTSPSLKH